MPQAASDHSASPIGSYLNKEELKSLQTGSPLRVSIDIGLTWLIIFATLAISARWPQPVVFAVCFIVISCRQLALTHLVHDASHFRLFRQRRVNDLVSDLLLAGPVAITTASYRAQHLPHHQHLGDRLRDTDQRAWYALKGPLFWRRTLLTLAGWEAITTFTSYAKVGVDSNSPSSLLWRLACAGLGNSVLLAYCWWLGAPLLYFTLWVLPLFTLTMLLQAYRVIAEHQGDDYAARGVDCSSESFDPPLTRSLECGPIEKFLIGPFNFHLHHEHHLLPSVPYHQLPRMHRLLLARGYFTEHPEALGSGYLATLRRLARPQLTGTPQHG